jgi:hypothetical protein
MNEFQCAFQCAPALKASINDSNPADARLNPRSIREFFPFYPRKTAFVQRTIARFSHFPGAPTPKNGDSGRFPHRPATKTLPKIFKRTCAFLNGV